MGLDKTSKESIIEEHSTSSSDTGSTEVQVALLTGRILSLGNHLRIHKHDEATRHGLLSLVGHRRRLLKYLNQKNVARYRALVTKLELRK